MRNCKGIFQAYGMTETSLAATKDIDDEKISKKPGSGGYPLPGVKAKVSFILLLTIIEVSRINLTSWVS